MACSKTPFENERVNSARGAKMLIRNKEKAALAIVQRASQLLEAQNGRMTEEGEQGCPGEASAPRR